MDVMDMGHGRSGFVWKLEISTAVAYPNSDFGGKK